MEQVIDINDIYEVMNFINKIVLNAKNPKSVSSSKYQKAQDIVNEMKASWSSFMEAVALESIISKITFEDLMSSNGRKIYQELSDVASKKNEYLENFKRLITKQKLGLFDEMNVISTHFIRYEKNLNGEMVYNMYVSKGNKDLQSLLNSLTVQGKGLLNILENLENSKAFGKESLLETETKLKQLSDKTNVLNYSSLSNLMENELGMKLDTTKLDELKLDYGKMLKRMQNLETVSKSFDKYRNYISPETFLKISQLMKEFDSVKSVLTSEEMKIVTGFENQRNFESEKVFGSEKANRLKALMEMITRGFDAEGKGLTQEKQAIITEELEKAHRESPELYKMTSNKFLAEEKARNLALKHEYSEKAKDKLDDSLLSLKEQEERKYYYDLFVQSKDLGQYISRDIYHYLYDKYLKLEQDDPLLLNQIINYYLSYLSLTKDQNRELDYTNLDEFINDMIVQDGCAKKEGR